MLLILCLFRSPAGYYSSLDKEAVTAYVTLYHSLFAYGIYLSSPSSSASFSFLPLFSRSLAL